MPRQPWHQQCDTCAFFGHVKDGQCLRCRDRNRTHWRVALDRVALAACAVILGIVLAMVIWSA